MQSIRPVLRLHHIQLRLMVRTSHAAFQLGHSLGPAHGKGTSRMRLIRQLNKSEKYIFQRTTTAKNSVGPTLRRNANKPRSLGEKTWRKHHTNFDGQKHRSFLNCSDMLEKILIHSSSWQLLSNVYTGPAALSFDKIPFGNGDTGDKVLFV